MDKYRQTSPWSLRALLCSPTAVVLEIIAILFFCWRLQIVPSGDDFVYSHNVSGDSDAFFEVQGTPIGSWTDVALSSWHHWLAVNGRLANIVTFAVMFLPVWVRGALCALAWGIMMMLIMVLGCGRRAARCGALTAAMALISWKWFPWVDNMALSCYYINYGWSCIAALGFVLTFRTGRYTWLCPLLGFITGWMHELYGLALLGAYSFLFITGHRYTPRQWIALCLLLAGTLLSALAPGTLLRINSQVGGEGSLSLLKIVERTLHALLHCLALYVYIIAMIAVWIKRGWRKVRQSITENILWWVVLAICALSVALLEGGPRMMWLADAGIMIALLKLIADNVPSWTKPHPAVTIILTLPSILLLIAITDQQREFSKVFTSYRKAAEEHQQPWIIRDITKDPQRKWWAFDIPSYPEPNTLWYYANAVVPRNERGCKDTNFLVTSQAADPRRPSFNDLPPLSGDGTIRGVWPWVYSTRPIEAGTPLTLTVGVPTDRMPPYLRLLINRAQTPNTGETGTDQTSTTREEAKVKLIHPIKTPAGEQIYILTLTTRNITQMCQIDSINP